MSECNTSSIEIYVPSAEMYCQVSDEEEQHNILNKNQTKTNQISL